MIPRLFSWLLHLRCRQCRDRDRITWTYYGFNERKR